VTGKTENRRKNHKIKNLTKRKKMNRVKRQGGGDLLLKENVNIKDSDKKEEPIHQNYNTKSKKVKKKKKKKTNNQLDSYR
jgi:hypothetical protein